jgi:trimeric autotransporter adhesin
MSHVNRAANARQPKRSAFRASLKTFCAALVFATAMGGASASAQGMFSRNIAARAQAQANSAIVVQSGANNGAAVSQQGAGNGGSISQTGNDNTATLHQSGDDNHGRLVQLGDGNTIAAQQYNNNNAICVIQRGDNLNLEAVQTGGDRVIISQNANRTRIVTNRVPRLCRTDRPIGNPNRGAWR